MNETDVTYDSSDATLESSRFWIQKVLVPIVACIGITGNTVTVMVLTRRRMRSSTNIYLSALAIADIIYLFFNFILSLKHYNNIHNGYGLYWRFVGISHWLADAASATSVWITVSFTIERYIAVCHPMKGKYFCTENRAKTATTLIYILCLLTTASTAFEYQLSINNTCIRECTVKESKKLFNLDNITRSFNNSNVHFIPNHIVLSKTSTKSQGNQSDTITVYNDPKLTTTLKNILSKCTTKHAHIIYIYPEIFNVTNERSLEENNSNVDKLPNMTIVHQFLNDTDDTNTDLAERNTEMIEEDIAENETRIESSNDTQCCEINGRIDIEKTELSKNPAYTAFIEWYSAIVFVVFPLFLIATFNSFLIHAVYRSQTQRRAMTNSNHQNQSQESISMSNENRITVMLIVLVITFLVCQLPQALHLIYYHSFPPSSNDRRSENVAKILGNIANFLVQLNSSCNFLFYSVLSKKFRGTFRKIFCERDKKQNSRQDTIQMSITKTRNSQKFNPYKHGIMRKNHSEYRTPRNLETQSLTGVPRSKSLMVRPVGKARSTDMIV